eukprot:TRINITY_DN10228_c0_g1_i1.p1 TRINITY_DN10228_c0_g1~~TRINITY_DN10228_c0_g1_i1.p1  ORF type:complete len:142 (+),score=17.86 TRINITY_DN10228_c0_g1_i1:150-575(+)
MSSLKMAPRWTLHTQTKMLYVKLLVNFHLHDSVKEQAKQLIEGFKSICSGQVLNMFTAEEMQALICGHQRMDFKELEESCHYDGGFHKDHKVIRWFWEIIHESFSEEQRKEFLVFCTGLGRVPFGGLKQLRMQIQRNGTGF